MINVQLSTLPNFGDNKHWLALGVTYSGRYHPFLAPILTEHPNLQALYITDFASLNRY